MSHPQTWFFPSILSPFRRYGYFLWAGFGTLVFFCGQSARIPRIPIAFRIIHLPASTRWSRERIFRMRRCPKYGDSVYIRSTRWRTLSGTGRSPEGFEYADFRLTPSSSDCRTTQRTSFRRTQDPRSRLSKEFVRFFFQPVTFERELADFLFEIPDVLLFFSHLRVLLPRIFE